MYHRNCQTLVDIYYITIFEKSITNISKISKNDFFTKRKRKQTLKQTYICTMMQILSSQLQVSIKYQSNCHPNNCGKEFTNAKSTSFHIKFALYFCVFLQNYQLCKQLINKNKIKQTKVCLGVWSILYVMVNSSFVLETYVNFATNSTAYQSKENRCFEQFFLVLTLYC
jgi:ABC-type uncharacterized transport system fused permease/ATPase subunit